MPLTPAIEPTTISAGDTLCWSRTLTDYSAADGWTLKYALQTASNAPITIIAAPNGTGFLVNVAANVSAGYPPGSYGWVAFVEQGTERHTVGRGSVTILASPTAALPESHAAKMLRLIRAALEGRIPNGLESSDIDGQRLDLIKQTELSRLEILYASRVQSEIAALSGTAGLGNGRTIYSRFTSVR